MGKGDRTRNRDRRKLLAAAEAAVVRGRTAEAIPLYQRALAEDPGNAEARYELGMCLLETGQLDEGIGELERATTASPDLADAVYDLGVAYEMKGDQPCAIACFRRALAADPDDMDVREHLAVLLEHRGDASGAAEVRRYQPAGLSEEERKRLAREYQQRGSYLERAIGAGAIGLFIAVCVLREVHRAMPAGRSMWQTVAPWLWALALPFVVSAVLFLWWLYKGAGLSQEVARRGARGSGAARIEAAVKAEVDRQEWEEFEQDMEVRDKLAAEERRGPPWWREELSGAHLVWWVALAVALLAESHVSPLLSRWGPVGWAVAVPGLLAKWCFWGLYDATSDEARIGRLRFYRWWGRGLLPVAIALAPGLVALLVVFG